MSVWTRVMGRLCTPDHVGPSECNEAASEPPRLLARNDLLALRIETAHRQYLADEISIGQFKIVIEVLVDAIVQSMELARALRDHVEPAQYDTAMQGFQLQLDEGRWWLSWTAQQQGAAARAMAHET